MYVRMYVCMCIYVMCVRTYVYVLAYVPKYLYCRTHVGLCVRTCMYVCAYMYVRMYLSSLHVYIPRILWTGIFITVHKAC
jgi:hypothetical protein